MSSSYNMYSNTFVTSSTGAAGYYPSMYLGQQDYQQLPQQAPAPQPTTPQPNRKLLLLEPA